MVGRSDNQVTSRGDEFGGVGGKRGIWRSLAKKLCGKRNTNVNHDE